jgi:hypothetical protein
MRRCDHANACKAFIMDKYTSNSFKLKMKLGKAKFVVFEYRNEGCKLYCKIILQ